MKDFADPLSEVTEYMRDEVGRVTRMTASNGTSTEWVVDHADNVARLTPASTASFFFDYDVPSKLLNGTRAPVVTSTTINAPSADTTGTRPSIGGVAFDYNLLANQLIAITVGEPAAGVRWFYGKQGASNRSDKTRPASRTGPAEGAFHLRPCPFQWG